MHFFINRPIFATVISLLITVVGFIAYYILPVAQYPEIALPTVIVRAQYSGATAETIAETVATPLEQEINGVENMLYMESSSTATGAMQLTITFEQGTNLDDAQVLVQNRVALAEPRLPEEVRQIGVTTQKSSPDMLMVVNLYSPDGSRSSLYLSNYVLLRIKDVLARQDGVGNVNIFGARDYSMRVWLDTDRLASLDMTTGDVIQALRQQNVQVAAGALGQPPTTEEQGAFQFSISTQGRLQTEAEFEGIVVKQGEGNSLVRLNDVARVELGAQDYSSSNYLDGQPSIGVAVFQRPGSNAVATSANIQRLMEELSRDFPPGVAYAIVYNPTDFVEESISQVYHTLFEATILVVLTVFIFLQNWRATIIPVVAIPVSLIGTFAAMLAMGFSLNNLSLFGLVLAIGIVVDDAIVVVENVEHWIERGLSSKEASHRTMDEVGSALVAASLVLLAVFVPTAFIPGISGQFYRQFAVTIAVSTTISLVVSLTLSPAMCALLLRPRQHHEPGVSHRPASFWGKIGYLLNSPLRWFFGLFNWFFMHSTNAYVGVVARFVRMGFIGMMIYAGLLAATWFGFNHVPTGFIPAQDLGYLIVSIELPPGASLARSDAVADKVKNIAMEIPGITHSISIVGFNGATRSNDSNAAAIFVILGDARERAALGQSMDQILGELRKRTASLDQATVLVIPPPPVPGIGTGGGFKMQVQNQTGASYDELQQAAATLAGDGMKEPGMAMVYTSFRSNTPLLYADINRTKAQILDVPLPNVFGALQAALGSVYVNDFNYLGRTYRVTAQAESKYRTEREDVLELRTRSNNGAIVPLGSILKIEQRTAPSRIVRYNLYPAADVSGSLLPGVSTGEAMQRMERLAGETLPEGFGYEWTDLSYQEKQAGNTILFIFPLCVLFVFLVLAAQYESWLLPLAIILIVPLGLLFAIAGIWVAGMDNNILTQIGFIVLVALACKNAILIVEFARSEEDRGLDRFDAAISASKLRLRPILMTALAFILGVVPLVIATGAGSEMRRALGTAVFGGMIGVTFFGLFLTPVFYVVLRRFARDKKPAPAGGAHHHAAAAVHAPSEPVTPTLPHESAPEIPPASPPESEADPKPPEHP